MPCRRTEVQEPPHGQSRCFPEPQREKKMPLLFYFPLIIWMGVLEAMQDEMRVPATTKARR